MFCFSFPTRTSTGWITQDFPRHTLGSIPYLLLPSLPIFLKLQSSQLCLIFLCLFPSQCPAICHMTYVRTVFSPAKCQLHEGRNLCAFWSWPYPLGLAQCLAHGGYIVSICRMTKWQPAHKGTCPLISHLLNSMENKTPKPILSLKKKKKFNIGASPL